MGPLTQAPSTRSTPRWTLVQLKRTSTIYGVLNIDPERRDRLLEANSVDDLDDGEVVTPTTRRP